MKRFLFGALIGGLFVWALMTLGRIFVLTELLLHPFSPMFGVILISPHEVLFLTIVSAVFCIADVRRIAKNRKVKLSFHKKEVADDDHSDGKESRSVRVV